MGAGILYQIGHEVPTGREPPVVRESYYGTPLLPFLLLQFASTFALSIPTHHPEHVHTALAESSASYALLGTVQTANGVTNLLLQLVTEHGGDQNHNR